MLIQYFSDIHLEFGPLDLSDSAADVIVAAGDIGLGLQGLDWLKTLSKPVVYVAGNHEFYTHEHAATVTALRLAATGSNVRFLERESWLCGDIRFLGCTLWSDLGGQERDDLAELVRRVNDFRKIRRGPDRLDPDAYKKLYAASRRWLLEQLALPFPGKTVIVTHHAPSPWSWRDNPGDVKRHAYYSDLKEVLHSYEIAAWFHGHTHAVSDYLCAGARILCNARGYAPDRRVPEFDPARVVEV
ncbi:Calcineurin-like phosphoesterase [Methylomagnum ishizawai]|uniref:Calcineurin-like phosphoesterase n=1 Tax=Methylomagnum ishizawai TaxID=1760988 RepID=A0A1Y6CWX1_9GAMM|nr:metallophosphoesterase [Methylomagnum ishizawai]SMF94837.1 Calcineurin-like phosphoesterase [Methylomagnum ishizawai]